MEESELIKKIKENNNTIINLVNNNNELIEKNKELVSVQFNMNKNGKFEFPKDACHDVKSICDIYRIEELTLHYQTQANIKYLIQLDEVWEYIKKNFNIFGQVLSSLIHYQIINWASISEAIIYDCLSEKNKYCNLCKKECCCDFKISNKNDFKSLLDNLIKLGYLNLNKKEIEYLKYCWQLRTEVHVNQMTSTIYNNRSLTEGTLLNVKNSVNSLFNSIIVDFIPKIKCNKLDKLDLLTYKELMTEIKIICPGITKPILDRINSKYIKKEKNYCVEDLSGKMVYKKAALNKISKIFSTM